MSRPQNPVTNEDLLDIIKSHMQMTAIGFAQVDAKLDRHEMLLNGHSVDINSIRRDLTEVKNTVYRINNEQHAMTSDIGDLYDRVVVLERKVA